jgi:HAD superfamily hydrolase (TIGR01509 family)
MPKACLFDLDGTLMMSEPMKARALAETCASFGASADADTYALVMGSDWPTVVGHFSRTYDFEPDLAEFDRRFRVAYDRLSADIVETPGASRLLNDLAAQGVAVGVVSSAPLWSVRHLLNRLAFEGSFACVITRDDVVEHKPSPAPYLAGLAMLEQAAADVLVFEDSEAGLRSAEAAGCRAVAVRHAFNRMHDFSLAVREITDFTQIGELWLAPVDSG